MWGVDEVSKVLFLTNSSGVRRFPSAIEVFKLVYDRKSVAENDLFANLRMSLPGLKFKPELAFPCLQIFAGEDNELALRVKLHNAEVYLDRLPDHDQYVYEGVWYPLDLQGFQEIAEKLGEGSIEFGGSLNPIKSAWLIWESGLSIDIEADPEDFRSSLLTSAISEFRSDRLEATLYPYQKTGARFLESMIDHGRGVLLADEMGLGKTLQAIYAIASNVDKAKFRNLVVVPASNLANWLREFDKFAPTLAISLHTGPRRAGSVRTLSIGNVLVTTYDVVFRDQAFLAEIPWDLVVLDEAQNIKNARAKRSQAVTALQKRSSIAITGTPIENSLSDIWSIFRFLDPSLLGDEYDFAMNYPDTNASAVQLSKKISPFVVRRRVSEVADDLPERSDFFVPIFLSEEMNSRYEDLRSDSNKNHLSKMQALRQLTSVPEEYSYASNKVARLIDLLSGAFANSDKAIIFTSFTESVDMLSRVIQTQFPLAFVETLDGRRTPAARQDVIDTFSSRTGASVLIANPRAAGVGLNIQAANYVFHFNPEWNPALIAQASARSYRRGQTKNVFIYYLFYRGTVEEYVLKKLEDKQSLQNSGLQELSEEPTESQLLEALKLSPAQIEGYKY